MGIDIPDWAISAEILTPGGGHGLPHLAAVGLAVALPHRVGLVAVHHPTNPRQQNHGENASCDTSPNFQAQTALEFVERDRICRLRGDIQHSW